MTDDYPVIVSDEDENDDGNDSTSKYDHKPAAKSSDLTEEQAMAVKYACAGHSLFITGPAGTGKSFTLRAVIKSLYKQQRKVVVTAPTGIAATQVSGITVHSALGLGIGDKPAADIVNNARRKPDVYRHWMCDTLVIDEVGMVSPALIDLIDAVAKIIRKRPCEAFGGMQLVLCGDFMQLEPVRKRRKESDATPADEAICEDLHYCFQTEAWKQMEVMPICLTVPFRQKDPALSSVLSRARMGELSDEDCETLKPAIDRTSTDEHTYIAPLREEVNRINTARLASIAKPQKTYSASMDITHEGVITDYTCVDLSNCWMTKSEDGEALHRLKRAIMDFKKAEPAPLVLSLKEGARVLLIANLDQEIGLVNGLQGYVVGFTDDGTEGDERPTGFPVVKFDNGVTQPIEPKAWTHEEKYSGTACYRQVPLLLGWAITIHKSQGCTISKACVSLARIFVYGQAYTAMSRVESLAGLCLRGFSPSAFMAHPLAVEFYKSLPGVAATIHDRITARTPDIRNYTSTLMPASIATCTSLQPPIILDRKMKPAFCFNNPDDKTRTGKRAKTAANKRKIPPKQPSVTTANPLTDMWNKRLKTGSS